MRTKLLPLVLVASLSFGAAVFAATTETKGTIKTIDEKSMTVTLADGSAYHLPAGFKVADLKVGEKVVMSWAAKGELKEVTGVKAM